MRPNQFNFIVFILTSILFSSCKNNPSEPFTNIETGRRDYVWTEDTLKTDELLHINRIWGSSPNDVWAVGISSWSATEIWHFNGEIWTCDSIYRHVNPWAIFGFSQNEVWLGNSNNTIWKFDGHNWFKYGEYKIENFDQVVILNFCGTAKDDIYGLGFAGQYSGNEYKGIIMHYNGSGWSFLNIPSIRASFNNAAIDQTSGNLIITGSNEDSGYVGKIFIWNKRNLTEIYSGLTPAVTKINDDIYITISQKIYLFTNDKLHLLIDKTGSEYIGKIWCGRSSSDFFWGTYNGIGHYNGKDFQSLYQFDYSLGDGIVFNEDVFFITRDFNRTGYNIILHGKLKQE